MKSISLRSGKTMVSTMTSVFFRPSETKSLRSFFFSPLPFPSISLYFEWCIRTGQWRTKVCLILCNRPRKPQFWHFLGFIFSFFFFLFFFLSFCFIFPFIQWPFLQHFIFFSWFFTWIRPLWPSLMRQSWSPRESSFPWRSARTSSRGQSTSTCTWKTSPL